MRKIFNLIGVIFFLFTGNVLFAQKPNWQNLDVEKEGVFGISTEKAYSEVLVNKNPHTVVVAIMDSGIDTTHEDLKEVLWRNTKEVPHDKLDNDHNGYADDYYGWNFIGGQYGNVSYDNLELTRIIRKEAPFYDSLSYTGVPDQFRAGYRVYRNLKRSFDEKREWAEENLKHIGQLQLGFDSVLSQLHKVSLDLNDIEAFKPQSDFLASIKEFLIKNLQANPDFPALQKLLSSSYDHFNTLVQYHLNLHFDPRFIVNDNYDKLDERYYGNSDVYGPNAQHGTHVAGIIAAQRNNGKGINGIADHSKLMIIRVVPNGDERDKDVANGIRYAVDNGASVINMSFGKLYSPGKKAVDEAVKYAMIHDVLIVHAAGNDGKNLDDTANKFYPSKTYADSSGFAKAWIEVGASDAIDDSTLVAPFSNYGKSKVDVFAPGVKIYSTVPGSKYEFESGTSMAAPVVTGLAALIREYYPKLSAMQVKEIIMRSVIKPKQKVTVKNGSEVIRTYMSDLCVSGGVVNSYEALKLAATY